MNEFSSNDFDTSIEVNRHDISNIIIENEPTEISNSYEESQFVGEYEYEYEYEHMETNDQDIIKNIKKYLLGVEQTGHFSCGGLISGAISPGLCIDDIGYVGFPLRNDQMQNVISKCKMAPFGRGEKILTDLNVRHTWQMELSQFKILNPKWDSMMKNIVTIICDKLVCDSKNVKHSLYKLLIYGPGSFFKPHRDTEKEHCMFGTLVIVLPNSYSGGQLIVRHNGEACEYDFSDAKNMFETKYAVFYADCEHEVKPVTDGYRVCLVYNLVNTSSDIPPSIRDDPVTLQNLIKAVNDWSLSSESCPGLLAYGLEHRYSNEGLSFSGLKGRDVVIARMLKKVSESVPLEIYLANVVRITYNFSRSRTNIINWISVEGKRPSEIELVSIRTNDMVQERFWENISMDKEESIRTGYDVNQNRFYHHSAVIFWPPKIKHRKYISKDVCQEIKYLKTLQNEDDIRKVTSMIMNNLENYNNINRECIGDERGFFYYGNKSQLYDLYKTMIQHNCMDQAIKFMIFTEDHSDSHLAYENSFEALKKLHESYPTIYTNKIFRRLAYRTKQAFELEAIKLETTVPSNRYLWNRSPEERRKAVEVLKMLDTNFFETTETDLSIVEPQDVFMDGEMINGEELDELRDDWPYEYEEKLLLEESNMEGFFDE